MFDKNRLADFFDILSRSSFALMLILIPFRLRTAAMLRPKLGIYGDYTDFLFYAMDAALLAMTLFWILSLLLKPRRLSPGPWAVLLPLTGFLASALVSLPNSLDPSLTIYHLLRFAALCVLYLFILNEIRSAIWFSTPLGLSVLMQSVIAVGQFLTQHDLGLRWLGEYPLDPTAQFMSVLEIDGVRFLRAYGLSDHPNILGGFLAFAMLTLLPVVLSRDGKPGWKFLAAFAFVAGSAGLFTTYSRSAWAALLAGALLIFGAMLYQRNWRGLMNGFLLMLICMMTVTPLAQNSQDYTEARLNIDNSFSNNRVERGSVVERLYLYAQSYSIVEQNAWTGVGLGASVIAMQKYYPVFKMSYQPPHVSILAAAMEMGYSGAVFYVALMILPFYVVLRNRRYWNDIYIAASLALILALAVIGLFDHYPWTLAPGRIMQWSAWGAFAAAVARLEAPDRQREGDE